MKTIIQLINEWKENSKQMKKLIKAWKTCDPFFDEQTYDLNDLLNLNNKHIRQLQQIISTKPRKIKVK